MKTKRLTLPVVFTLIGVNWFFFSCIFCWITTYLVAVILPEVGLLARS